MIQMGSAVSFFFTFGEAHVSNGHCRSGSPANKLERAAQMNQTKQPIPFDL